MTLTAALGGDAEPRKAQPVALTAVEPASTAFVTIAAECVDHWCANEALLMESRAMPHLHQTRVGIRRLRSSFSLFRPLLRHVPGSADVAHRLRTLALPFGAARDLDVLLAGHHVERLDEQQVALLWRAREAAYDEVLSVLRSGPWEQANRALEELLTAAPWDLADDPPIRPLADRALERRWRRVVAHADRLGDMSPQERHRVRIEAKKLRYGCEFFAPLYAGDAPRVVTETGVVLTGPLAYGWQVEHVQSSLGALNDHHTADHLLRTVGSQAPRVDETALLDTGAGAVQALAAVPPFWH